MPEAKQDEHLDTGGANVEVNAQAFLDPSVPDPVLDGKGREVKSRSDMDKGQEAILSPEAKRTLEDATMKDAQAKVAKPKAEPKAEAKTEPKVETAKPVEAPKA